MGPKADQMEAQTADSLEHRPEILRMHHLLEVQAADHLVGPKADQMEAQTAGQMEAVKADYQRGQSVHRPEIPRMHRLLEGQMVDHLVDPKVGLKVGQLAQEHHPLQNLQLLLFLQQLLLPVLHPRQVLQLLRWFPLLPLQGLSVALRGRQMRHRVGFQLEHLFALLLFVQQMFFFPPWITPHTGHMARLK